MNPFRTIVDDTRNLLRDIRRGWGHLVWRLSWWRRRRQMESERSAAEAENLARAASAGTKMCRECRALIGASERVCPECGANTSQIRSGGAGRLLPGVLPGSPTVSSLLVTAYFALFLAGVAITTRLPAPPGQDPPNPLQAILNLDGRALVITGAIHLSPTAGTAPWRLLTAIFLHAGIVHILFNSLAMRVIGPLIEELYGPRRMFVLYLFTGVASNIVSLWWHGDLPWFTQVGASGAIFGFIGIAGVYGLRRRDAAGEALRRHMMEWAIYGIVMGILFRADNAAHIGGLLAGAGVAFLLRDPHEIPGRFSERLWGALSLLGLLATLASFALVAWFWAGEA